MSGKIENFVFRSAKVRLRWIVSLLTLLSVLLLGCEDDSDSGGGSGGGARSAPDSFLKISEASGVFQIDELVVKEIALWQGGKAAESVGVGDLLNDLRVRWGFRRKNSQGKQKVSEIYWIQKHKSYKENTRAYKQNVENGKKTRFAPLSFPPELLQEADSDLQVYAHASLGDMNVFGAIDLPPGFIDALTRRRTIRGRVLDENGEPAMHAGVYYVGKASSKIFQVFTGDDGTYEVQVPNHREFYQVVLLEGARPSVAPYNLPNNLPEGKGAISGVNIRVASWPSGAGIFERNVLYDARALARVGGKKAFIGKTLEMEDQKPLPGVAVLLYDRITKDQNKNLKFVFSGAKGAFRFPPPHESSSDCGYAAAIYGHSLVRERKTSLPNGVVLRFAHNEGYSHPASKTLLDKSTSVIYAVPANFTVGTLSSDSIELKWDAVRNAAHYRLSYGKGGSTYGSVQKLKFDKNDGRITYVVKNLEAGAQYSFKIRSEGSGGQYGDYSDAKDAATLEVLPAPQNLKLEPGQNQTLALSWGSVANADHYTVSWGTDGNADNFGDVEYGTRYAITGLEVGKGLFAKVKAMGGISNSGILAHADSKWSEVVDNSVSALLDVPQNLRATVSGGDVLLNWGSVANASGYEVSYGKSEAAADKAISFDANSAKISSGFAVNTEYYFKVRATGESGYRNSAYSSAVKITTPKVSLPAPVVSPGSSTADSVNLKIEFADASLLSYVGDYEISYGTSRNATGSTKKISGGSSLALATIGGLKANIQYYFKGRVLGGPNGNNSAYSRVVVAKTRKLRMPAPQNIRLAQVSRFTGEEVLQANWDAVPNAIGYKLQLGVKNGSGYNWMRTENAGSSTTSKMLLTPDDSGDQYFTPGTTYYVNIVALPSDRPKFDQSVDAIVELAFVRRLLAPPQGLAVKASRNNTSEISVKWAKVGDAGGYEVHWGTSAAANGGKKNVAATNTSTVLSGLKADTLYSVKVKALAKADSKYRGDSNLSQRKIAKTRKVYNLQNGFTPKVRVEAEQERVVVIWPSNYGAYTVYIDTNKSVYDRMASKISYAKVPVLDRPDEFKHKIGIRALIKKDGGPESGRTSTAIVKGEFVKGQTYYLKVFANIRGASWNAGYVPALSATVLFTFE